MVRGGWVEFRHLVAPLTSGSVRPGESVVKPSHRYTKARRGTRALVLLLERVASAAVSEALDQSASIIAPGREGSELGQPPLRGC